MIMQKTLGSPRPTAPPDTGRFLSLEFSIVLDLLRFLAALVVVACPNLRLGGE